METYLNNKFGWSLGNKKGLYVWPYSSCTGHTTDKGNYVSNDLEDKCIANGCKYINSFREML